jgi:hypothetical protein
LLIEESIRMMLSDELERPKALDDARLSFHQAACLAEAMYANNAPRWLWKAIKMLNKIRNMVSHELEPGQRSEKISEFVHFVESNEGVINSELSLESAISGLYVHLGITHDKQTVSDREQGKHRQSGEAERPAPDAPPQPARPARIDPT